MNLENIGFYTLSNKRAKNVSWESDLQRCELILTNRCNFKCLYCRGIKNELCGDISLNEAKHIIDIMCEGNIRNIRFSGGEPTLWKNLPELIQYVKTKKCIEHIAISTNGSASIKYYLKLYRLGVNDFSISLDACCAMNANLMAGTDVNFAHISKVIRILSNFTYVTVGVVLDKHNENDLNSIINYATSLGVSDIRIIPSAQYNQPLNINLKTDYRILSYRINNIKKGQHVRGLNEADCNKCHLVKDDIAVLHNEHFPCIIYMREQGKSIGNIDNKTISEIRNERKKWFDKTNTYLDPICRKNCLDVCVEYNNKVQHYLK